MKLGSFWGMTAPMLVIATKKNGIEKIKPFINVMNKSYEIQDVKSELVFLYKALDNIPKNFYPSEATTPLKEFDSSARVINGKIYGDSIDEQEFYVSLATEFIIKLLKEHLQKGKEFNLTIESVVLPDGSIDSRKCIQNRVNVINQVKKLLEKKDFYLTGIQKVFKELIRELKTDTSVCDYDSLAKSFSLSTKIPENFIINGNSITLTEKERKFLEYFCESQPLIKELLVNFKVEEIEENRMFEQPFRELIIKKPRALYRTIQNRFDLVKSKNNASFLNSMLKELNTDLNKFKTAFSTEVVSTNNARSVLTGMTYEDLRKILYSFSTEKREFFESLIGKGYVLVKDLLLETFNLLSEMYDVVYGLNIVELNTLFDLNYTRSDWEKFINKLNIIGICGVNLYPLNLFELAIKNKTFISNNVIVRTEEDISEFKVVIANIEALLSTIKPVGFVLE